MKIQDLYDNPKKWTRGSSARDRRGYRTSPIGRYAKSWCITGAMKKCYCVFSEYEKAARKIEKELGCSSVMLWNDNKYRTFQDVKDLVTRLDI